MLFFVNGTYNNCKLRLRLVFFLPDFVFLSPKFYHSRAVAMTQYKKYKVLLLWLRRHAYDFQLMLF
jgi:hypothetical protein